ncbi:hypothetical protein Tco_0036340, partial [Tanacetum coccineum]
GVPVIEDWEFDSDDEKKPKSKVEKKTGVFKTISPTVSKIEFVRPKQQENPVRKPVKYAQMYSFDHLQYTCKQKRQLNGQRKEKPVWKNTRRVNDHYFTRMTHSNQRRNMIPQAVLMRSGIKAVNTAKPKDAHNAVKRNKFNDVKASACWVWMPKNRVVDHVSKNISASVTLKRLDYIDAQGRFKLLFLMDAQTQGRQECSKSAVKKKKNPEKSAAKAERQRR